MQSLARTSFALLALLSILIAPARAQPNPLPLGKANASELLEPTLSAVTAEITKKAKARGVTAIAITKLYHNGSSTHPAAVYIQRKLTGEMLNHSTGLSIVERDDLQVLVGENQLQFWANGEHETSANPSDAMLTGELLSDSRYGECVLSVRLVDTQTTSILAASVSIIRISPDLAARLGNIHADSVSGNLPFLRPPFMTDGRFVGRLKDVGALSLAPLSAIPSNRLISARILYANLVAHLVQSGIPVLERELLNYIMAEKAISRDAVDRVISGMALIQISADETSPLNSPTFFIKAIRRRGGEILAQEEVALASAAASAAVAVAKVGSDDSMEAAIRAHRQAGAIPVDALRFVDSFVLSDTMKLSQNRFRPTDSPHGRKIATVFGWNRSPGYGLSFTWHNLAYLDQPQYSGRAMFDWYLDELVSSEKGDAEAIKAALVSVALLGGEFKIDNETMHHIGPIHEVYTTINRTLSINNNLTPSPHVWHDCFMDFSKRLYAGTNPRLTESDSLPGYRGAYKASIRGFEIEFDFVVESVWRGKYPSQVKIEIDMAPMRDRLFRITRP